MAKGNATLLVLGLGGAAALFLLGRSAPATATPVAAGPPTGPGGPLPGPVIDAANPTPGSAVNPSTVNPNLSLPQYVDPRVITMWIAAQQAAPSNVTPSHANGHGQKDPAPRPEDSYPVCRLDDNLPDGVRQEISSMLNSYPGPDPVTLQAAATAMSAAGYPMTAACLQLKASGQNLQV